MKQKKNFFLENPIKGKTNINYAIIKREKHEKISFNLVIYII